MCTLNLVEVPAEKKLKTWRLPTYIARVTPLWWYGPASIGEVFEASAGEPDIIPSYGWGFFCRVVLRF